MTSPRSTHATTAGTGRSGRELTATSAPAVDVNDWLENGSLPAEGSHLRREALRVVRFIEYGGPLRRLEGRETLIECRQRSQGRGCGGFLWVSKRADNRISVFCSRCHKLEAVISGWEDTVWADGPMPPLPMIDD